jgi:hypothetical protein
MCSHAGVPHAWVPHPCAPHALLTHVLDHSLALLGRRVAPLLAQHVAPCGRQLLEAVEVLAHSRLLGG